MCVGFFFVTSDPLQPIRCGIITQQFLAEELGLSDTNEIIMIRTFNESLVSRCFITQRGITANKIHTQQVINPLFVPCIQHLDPLTYAA